MKQRMNGFLAVIVAVGLFTGLSQVSAAYGAVTLEVLNPRGEIKALPVLAPAPRVTDLAGKKIGIYWIGKAGGNNFWDEIEQLLKAKFPTAHGGQIQRSLRPRGRYGGEDREGVRHLYLRRGRLRVLHMGRRVRPHQIRKAR